MVWADLAPLHPQPGEMLPHLLQQGAYLPGVRQVQATKTLQLGLEVEYAPVGGGSGGRMGNQFQFHGAGIQYLERVGGDRASAKFCGCRAGVALHVRSGRRASCV